MKTFFCFFEISDMFQDRLIICFNELLSIANTKNNTSVNVMKYLSTVSKVVRPGCERGKS